tara:strand:+ start:101 stop:718 length:618 start_codon:yes stop_codon:yes gene_type:complete
MKNFPKQIPIFPLSGVIYFPKTNLPLNIFEQRYLDLVNDALKKDKLMGMIQSKKNGREVYKIGCLGKINDYEKNDDGRVIINLTGITRFEVLQEKVTSKLYREFMVNYEKFTNDLNPDTHNIDTNDLMFKMRNFFKSKGIFLNWREFEKLNISQKINTLAMIAPFSNEEKQKLLESVSLNEKVKTLENITSFYLHEVNFKNLTIQ